MQQDQAMCKVGKSHSRVDMDCSRKSRVHTKSMDCTNFHIDRHSMIHLGTEEDDHSILVHTNNHHHKSVCHGDDHVSQKMDCAIFLLKRFVYLYAVERMD